MSEEHQNETPKSSKTNLDRLRDIVDGSLNVAKKTYSQMEARFGQDRAAGIVVGANKGAIGGALAGNLSGLFIGAIIGAGVGGISGRPINNWLKAGRNDGTSPTP